VTVALEEQFLTAKADDLFSGCFGCGPEHPIGLRVRCFKTDEGVLAPVVVPRRFEGPRGAAHGGIVTTYLDEILAGAAFRATGRLSVTASSRCASSSRSLSRRSSWGVGA